MDNLNTLKVICENADTIYVEGSVLELHMNDGSNLKITYSASEGQAKQAFELLKADLQRIFKS